MNLEKLFIFAIINKKKRLKKKIRPSELLKRRRMGSKRSPSPNRKPLVYSNQFQTKWKTLSSDDIYNLASIMFMLKLHEINYLPTNGQALYRLYGQSLGISLAQCKKFITFISNKTGYKRDYIVKGKPVYILNNWQYFLEKLGLWYCFDMKFVFKMIKTNAHIYDLNFSQFREFFHRTVLMTFLRRFSRTIKRQVEKLEFIKLFRKNATISHFSNQVIWNRYERFLRRMVRKSNELSMTTTECIAMEERSLCRNIHSSNLNLSKLSGFNYDKVGRILRNMEKDKMLTRTSVQKYLAPNNPHFLSAIMEEHGYYSHKNEKGIFIHVYSEFNLSYHFDINSKLSPQSVLLTTNKDLQSRKIKRKYRLL